MRIILFFYLYTAFLFGGDFTAKSFGAKFTQTITNDENATIVYKGELYARDDNYALWIYEKPVIKKIYLKRDQVTIVEPELEQAIISRLSDSPKILEILQNAKKISPNTYLTKYQENEYLVKLENNTPKNVSYKDKLDNKILIEFEDVQIDTIFEDILFAPQIPSNYDLIRN